MTGEAFTQTNMEQRYRQHLHAVEAITDLALELEREGVEPIIVAGALEEVAKTTRNNS